MIDTCQHIIQTNAYTNAHIDSLLFEQGAKMDTLSRQFETLLSNGTDYASEVKVFALPIIIAVVGFMIPLLFSVAVRIDEKYAAREFKNMFLRCYPLLVFYVLAPLNIITYFAYAHLRLINESVELGLRVTLCTLATFLLIDAFLGLKKALDFCNEKSLLLYVKKRFLSKYDFTSDYKRLLSSISNDKQELENDKSIYAQENSDLQRFYSLLTHLICYAFEKNIAFLYDIRNVLIEHLKTWKQGFLALNTKGTTDILYYTDVYELICYISSAYKKHKSDPEINAIFANIFISLLDTTGKGQTNQNTYNALYQALVSCVNNEHDSLINDFQKGLRTIYLFKKKNGSKEDTNALLIFAIILNATLYSKKRIECVDNAIDNNFDAVIIGDAVILPLTARECLQLYLYMMNLPHEKLRSYVYTLSNFTSSSNYSQLHQALTEYFAYLTIRQYRENEENYSLDNVEFYSYEEIKEKLDWINRSMDNIMAFSPKTRLKISHQYLISCMWDNTYKAKVEYILNAPIELHICKQIITQSINQKDLFNFFKNVVTFEDSPLDNEKDECKKISHWGSCQINRACILAKDNIMLEDFDFGSRIIEHFAESIANIYNLFEREEEFVCRSQLFYRVTQYFKQYDCSFITIGMRAPRFGSYIGSHSFTKLFPLQSIIVIQHKDMPRIEWNPDNLSILSIKDCEMRENEMPKIELEIDLGARIMFNKNTKIRVLRVK